LAWASRRRSRPTWRTAWCTGLSARWWLRGRRSRWSGQRAPDPPRDRDRARLSQADRFRERTAVRRGGWHTAESPAVCAERGNLRPGPTGTSVRSGWERVPCTGAVLRRPAGRGRGQGPGGGRKFRPLEAKPDNTQIYEGTSQIRRMGMARQLIRLKAGHRQAISWNFCRAGHPAAIKRCVDAHGAV
jgi:hypothetical protein